MHHVKSKIQFWNRQIKLALLVRLGDMAAAFVVFAGTSWLALEARGFAALNVAFVLVWLAVAVVLMRENRRLSASKADGSAGATR